MNPPLVKVRVRLLCVPLTVRRFVLLFAILSVSSLAALNTSARAQSAGEIAGFTVAARTTLSPGVEHIALKRTNAPLSVHVARIAADAPLSVRAVLSNNLIADTGDRLERTSSMCARLHCVAAVNADFALPGTDEPVGGFITGGILQRSPSTTHHQFVIRTDGHLEDGPLSWTGKLVGLDLREIAISGVNIDRGDDALVAYTPAWGPSTLTNEFGAELVGHVVGDDVPAGTLGATTVVEFDGLRDAIGNATIPADGIVFSGHGRGADALRDFWTRAQTGTDHRALLRFDTASPALESVGGTPVLLRDGKRWFGDDAADFVRGRHPRTLVGWTASGDVLLVTVDGRQPTSEGVTLADAADLMANLGATDAINLDGGGSTTFVAAGQVVNSPSDVAVRHHGKTEIVHQPAPGDAVIGRVERPVVSALAVVPDLPVKPKTTNPLAHVDIVHPSVIPLAATRTTDPASTPNGTLPALVTRHAARAPEWLLALAFVLHSAVTLSLAHVRAHRRAALAVNWKR